MSIASDIGADAFVHREHCDLLCEIGSGAHGLALEGTDDHDEMGILCEPKWYVLGLRKWETTVRRTKPDGTPIPDGERSQHGDTDLVVHSVRKWVSLALNGNPTIITLMYAPLLQEPTDVGHVLRDAGHYLLSRRALDAYLGYLTQQKERMLGTRGQKRTKRPELVEAHGFDTKYACHALRLGWQGVELAQLGKLELPMQPPQREFLLRLRRGQVPFDDAMAKIVAAERTLEFFKHGKLKTVLPERPDYDWANDFLVWAYETSWGADPTRPVGDEWTEWE